MYPSRHDLIEQLHATHYKSMLAEAATERLLRVNRSFHPGRVERTMVSLANWLIRFGERMRQRYELPVSAPESNLRTQP